MEWQPIETAPRDGTVIDLYCYAPMPDCRWHATGIHADARNGWQQQDEHNPGWWHWIEVTPTAWNRRTAGDGGRE